MPDDTHKETVERLQRLRHFVVGLEGRLSQLASIQKDLGISIGLSPDREWARAASLHSQRESRSQLLDIAKFVSGEGKEFGFADEATFFGDAIAATPKFATRSEVFDLLGQVSVHGAELLRRGQTLWQTEV